MRQFGSFVHRQAVRPARRLRRGFSVACAFAATLLVAGAAVSPADETATFAISNETPFRGEAVTFSASDACAPPISCAWSVDGVHSGDGPVLEWSFADLGPHEITLTAHDVGDEREARSEVTRTVEVVNQVPVVALDHVAAGLKVSFAARASDPDGDDLAYAWDFGDGSTSTSSDPEHEYSSPGVYAVELTVTDTHDAITRTAIVTVAAPNVRPTAGFSVRTVGLTAHFDASTSVDPDEGDQLTYSWSFGDGEEGSGPVVSHTYDRSDRFDVSLTVSDRHGASDFESREVMVNRPPVARIVSVPSTALVGQSVSFRSESSDPDGDGIDLAWDASGGTDFADGGATSITRAFASPGSHLVRLRATDDHGAVHTASATVTVMAAPVHFEIANKPPVASFVVSPENPKTGDTLMLTSQSSDPDGRLAAHAWDLDGDGFFDDAEGVEARVRIDKPGKVSFGLRVVDEKGAMDSTRREVDIAAHEEESTPVPKPSARLLSPFPAVRVAGSLTPRGAALRLVQVTAPRGARVSWSCSARACRSASRAANGRALRIRALQRAFKAGTEIEFRITQRGRIGKYTRIRIRRNRAPVRRDLCLPPASRRPASCPS